MIFQAMMDVNRDHMSAYGECRETKEAEDVFKNEFGDQARVFFVFSGTAANVLALRSLTRSYQGVLCSSIAHIYSRECGAPESFACKLLPVDHDEGKIVVKNLEPYVTQYLGDQHSVQPKIVSITQITERGAVYTPEEIQKIADFCHSFDLYLHMDGSRLFNAAITLGCSLKEITTDVGVDILSLGGTKNGMLLGESVVFLKSDLEVDFKYLRKNSLQLFSKMRFFAAQYKAFFHKGYWKKNARHSNTMACMLKKELEKISQITIRNAVQGNMLFVCMPQEIIPELQEAFPFYINDAVHSEVRLVTTFDTTPEDIRSFVDLIALKLEKCNG